MARGIVARIGGSLALTVVVAVTPGCRSHRLARFAAPLPGGMASGRETSPSPRIASVDDAVATLLARHVGPAVVQATAEDAQVLPPAAKRIVILPAAAGEGGKGGARLSEQLRATIAARIGESQAFEPVAEEAVADGLEAAAVAPGGPFDRAAMQTLVKAVEQRGLDVDYLLSARVRSGRRLELELIDVRTWKVDAEAVELPGRGSRIALRAAD